MKNSHPAKLIKEFPDLSAQIFSMFSAVESLVHELGFYDSMMLKVCIVSSWRENVQAGGLTLITTATSQTPAIATVTVALIFRSSVSATFNLGANTHKLGFHVLGGLSIGIMVL